MSVEAAEQWSGLWRRLDADAGTARVDGTAILDDLIVRYAERPRAYHTLEHILHCLGEFAGVRERADEPEAVEMAIWFHDAVYNPLLKNNERKSADLAAGVLGNAGLGVRFIQTVTRLIIATEHTSRPSLPDDRLLVDIDLSILGQPETIYDRYEDQIRQEYSWVPRPLFRSERAKILRGFLERPVIYETDNLRARYEAQARGNLERTLQTLG